MNLAELPGPGEYAYRGARALVVLHERELRDFLTVWRRIDAAGLQLPETDDPSYLSNLHLLQHVLRAAGRYLEWICRQLELPEPGIRQPPEPSELALQAGDYLEHVLDRWRRSLTTVPESLMEQRAYTANWGAPMTIESMLEHAVMHPLRHTFQLEELMARSSS